MGNLTIITGHYGSGKTNVAINLALEASKKYKNVSIIDLDIVNPYFRTSDFSELFKNNNIELIKPKYANSNLDIPSLCFDINAILSSNSKIIIDVGGDDSGAYALGRYSSIINEYKDELNMYYVVNFYRFLTTTARQALNLMYDIESASQIKHTGIINNSNLGDETTIDTVLNSFEFAKQISQISNLPIVFTTINNKISQNYDIFKPVDIHIKPIWE